MEDKPKGKSKRVIIIAAASAAVLAAALVILAVLGVFTPGKEYGHFYIQNYRAYYVPGEKDATAMELGVLPSGDFDAYKPFYSATQEGIIFPVGTGDTYALLRRAADSGEDQTLVSSVTRSEVLGNGHIVLEDSGRLYDYDGQGVTELASGVSEWGRLPDGESVWCLMDEQLCRMEPGADEPEVLVQGITDDGAFAASDDGRVFRYRKDGAVWMLVDGEERELTNGELYGDSAELFYITREKVLEGAPVSSYVTDDMSAADKKPLKEPSWSDFTYDRWTVEFWLKEGINRYYFRLPENSSIARSYHDGKATAKGIIDWITGNWFPKSDTGAGFPFSESDVKRLSTYFRVVKTTESNSGTYEKVTYHGTGPSVTIDGEVYDTEFNASKAWDDYVDTDGYSEANKAYQDAVTCRELREEIRASMDKTPGTVLVLYRCTPEEGLVQVEDMVYRCSVKDGELETVKCHDLLEIPETYTLSELDRSGLHYLSNRIQDYLVSPSDRHTTYPLEGPEEEPSPAPETEEKDELPQKLLEEHPEMTPALELEGGDLLLYEPSGSLYLYDGGEPKKIAENVQAGGWAGESRNGLYYLGTDGCIYYYNGRKSVLRMSGSVTALW